MKIAIIGAGFTGLAAALKLSENPKYSVTVYESEKDAGGLAGSFKFPSWQFSVEKHYHHWFSNDHYALSLIKNLGLDKELIFPKTVTSLYFNNKSYPFNSPFDLLSFSPFAFTERIRSGLILLYLKLLSPHHAEKLENQTAYKWLEKSFGKKPFDILWKPLLVGKFGKFARLINMTWFWARIKKRTMRLGYLKGGYRLLTEKMITELEKRNVKILFSMPFNAKYTDIYDKIIVTTPTAIFLKLFPELPANYKQKLNSIPHLSALNLILITKKKFLEKEYWLNINDSKYPFLGIIQQTNLIDKKYFGNQNITYVANYLPSDHPYLKLSKDELFKIYLPYLKKVNPCFDFQSLVINHYSFSAPSAQPVFIKNYSRIKPDFTTPLPKVLLANMDMVYPWDRGTNYAIELGYKAAELV
jgi:protoporphyrinogen oxidase